MITRGVNKVQGEITRDVKMRCEQETLIGGVYRVHRVCYRGVNRECLLRNFNKGY